MYRTLHVQNPTCTEPYMYRTLHTAASWDLMVADVVLQSLSCVYQHELWSVQMLRSVARYGVDAKKARLTDDLQNLEEWQSLSGSQLSAVKQYYSDWLVSWPFHSGVAALICPLTITVCMLVAVA